jgi:hypothetical protein
MLSMRRAASVIVSLAAVAAECCNTKASYPAANVVLASGVGAARYSAGACGDGPDASAAECFRGPQPHTDEGSVHLPGEPGDGGLDASAATDPDAGPDAAPPDAAVMSPEAAASTAAGPPRCRHPSGGLRRLRSWADARVRDQYEVVLTRASEWVPKQRIEMPLQHATRLELENPDGFEALTQTAEPVRVQLELVERDIQHDTARGIWLVTWHARVLDACVAPR